MSGYPRHATAGRLGALLAALAFVASVAGCSSSLDARSEADWHARMPDIPLPNRGCFHAAYPKLAWLSVPCTAAPNVPYPPGHGRHIPFTVGGGGTGNYAAEVGATITSATGSFPTVTGVTSETGASSAPNTYSLQLNTKPFTTSICAGHPSCLGWQQFLYSNQGIAWMQYWLEQYNATCPAGWMTYQFPPPSTDIYCYRNSSAVSVATQPITNLGSLSLTGSATSGGNDTVIMTTAAGDLNATNADTVLNLAGAWTGVEFLIVGDGNRSQADFNAGSTISVRTVVHYGSTAAPTCVMESFTGETNNLTLIGAGTLGTQPAPAIQSSQSNATVLTPATCATASGVGDPHLQTFLGLLYDFQATGDFLLAQTDQFSVVSRQISGGSSWPDVAINSAVGTEMGKSQVAICGGETPVFVDGKPTPVADGQDVQFPDLDVIRSGNVYIVVDLHGNSLRAAVNNGWIDASVGLGQWPTKVVGLLANGSEGLTTLAARDGVLLKVPAAFGELYGHYGESWRVPNSLLNACGPETEHGNPGKPFTASDLDGQTRERVQAVCAQAGVKDPALLAACELDVAVLGPDAAKVYVGASPPSAVGQ